MLKAFTFGATIMLWIVFGNVFLFAQAQDMVTFTAPITTIGINLWAGCLLALCLIARRACD